MKKKLALLLVLVIGGVAAMAQTCVILGATVVIIDDEVWYSAEIRNDTNADILNHRMAVGFIDGADLAVAKNVDMDGDADGTLCLRSLQSGESNYFSSNSELEDDEVDTAVTRLIGPLTFGQVVPSDLTFSNIEVTRNGETLVVTGRIKNNDNDTIDDLRVCVVVRNEDGDVTRVDVDDDEFDGVDEDDTVEFTIETTVPDDTDDVDIVDLYADGVNADDDDQVIEPVEDLDNSVDECPDATNTPTNTTTPNTPTNTPTDTNTPTETNTPGGTVTPTVTNTPTATNTPDDAC